MQTQFDAVVIGAGPAGSAAAILLAQAGWSVALIERQAFPRRKVCGECIAASNLPLLDALGVGPEFSALAGPALRRVALWAGERSATAALPALEGSAHAWGRALGREHLDLLLLQRAKAAGAAAFQPCAVQSLAGEPGDFRCTLEARESGERITLHAPVAIGAYGSCAPRPGGQGHRRPRRRADGLIAFKANFAGARLDAGLLPVLSFRGGYGGMVVAGQGRVTLACCIRRERLQELRRAAPGAAAGAVVEASIVRECAGVRAALAGASRLGPWISTGAVTPGVRLSPPAGARWRSAVDGPLSGGGAFLIGNAAGEAHPLIGEGISMAIQSAWLLCDQLLHSPDARLRGPAGQRRQREIHERYARQWRAHFRARLRVAGWLARMAMRPGVTTEFLRLRTAAPGVLTRFAHWSGKVRGL